MPCKVILLLFWFWHLCVRSPFRCVGTRSLSHVLAVVVSTNSSGVFWSIAVRQNKKWIDDKLGDGRGRRSGVSRLLRLLANYVMLLSHFLYSDRCRLDSSDPRVADIAACDLTGGLTTRDVSCTRRYQWAGLYSPSRCTKMLPEALVL